MYSGYYYPYYRSFGYPVYPAAWGYPYGPNYSSNIIGSAVSNQNLVNTGTAIGVNQNSSPTVIW